jgi:hypothetical protein
MRAHVSVRGFLKKPFYHQHGKRSIVERVLNIESILSQLTLHLTRWAPLAAAPGRACLDAKIFEFFSCCLNSELVLDEILHSSMKRLVIDMTVRDVVYNVSHGVACGGRKEQERAGRTAHLNRKSVKRSANRQLFWK